MSSSIVQPGEDAGEKHKRTSVVARILRSILIPSSYFGFFPIGIDNNNVVCPPSTLSVISSFLICCFAIPTSLHHLFTIGLAIAEKNKITEIITQVLWFSSTIIPVCVSLFMQLKRKSFIKLFTTCAEKEIYMRTLIPFEKLESFGHKCLWFYGIMAAISTTTLGIHSIYNARMRPYFLRYWWPDPEQQVPFWVIPTQTIVVVVHISWIWLGTCLFEIWCCLRARAIVLCFEEIQLASERIYKLGMQSDLQPGAQSSAIENPSWNRETPENGNGNGPVGVRLKSGTIYRQLGIDGDAQDDENAPILRFIRCYQDMASLQGDVNGFVGPLLAMDFAQVIIMTCSVSFLSYKHSANLDLSLMLTYYSNAVCVTARLINLIVSLGNLYSTSEETNLCFGNIISRRTLPITVHNRVMGHLAAYSSSPICYSVWGFSPVTRGSLLATFSVIITYLVLLVQS